ncbi:MAG: ABC transporter permease [Rhodospirillales bacterium]|nr:ABC transporter permease [Rhodospirillales bacterium]MDE2197428.1 ABC transporter permease [Rhodospirillales bacterium]MDE2574418.1 ABC transporter permease [Rhodospirillales bacterium]
MWRRFCRHRLALLCLGVTLLLYALAAGAEFVAPSDPDATNARMVFHPPQVVHWLVSTPAGFAWRPFVYAEALKRDPVTLAPAYVVDPTRRVALGLFVHGTPYRLWGLLRSDIHLFGAVDPGAHVFLLGADRLGRDMLSRIVFGARVSLSVGLVGVLCSLVLGIVLGGISGYFGGQTDWLIQRVIEFILSLPTIPVWLALAAALPKTWSPITTYFMITLIISLVGWTQLARVIRGRFLVLRGETYITAAMLDGCSQARVIFRHMLPALTSHIIASITLAVPQMILAETALSFLGLGLQPPAISWGTLLEEAQNVNTLASAPWLLLPGVAVAIAVLALNFLGDGLRDAADPHA